MGEAEDEEEEGKEEEGMKRARAGQEFWEAAPAWRFATGDGVEPAWRAPSAEPAMAEGERRGELLDAEPEAAGDQSALVAGRREPQRWESAEAAAPPLPSPRRQPIALLPAGLGTSLDDAVPVTLYFVNQTTHMVMEVCWVDYEGQPVPRKRLQPGDVHLERSWSTHPWLLTAVEPPPFDPEYHHTPEEADRHAPEPQEQDMALVVRLGDVAARDELRRYSLLWQPRERALSLMPAARATAAGELREDLRPENAVDSRTRVRNTRAALVHDLRALRADPSGGANHGEPPVLTVFMMGQRRGESVIGPLLQARSSGHR